MSIRCEFTAKFLPVFPHVKPSLPHCIRHCNLNNPLFVGTSFLLALPCLVFLCECFLCFDVSTLFVRFWILPCPIVHITYVNNSPQQSQLLLLLPHSIKQLNFHVFCIFRVLVWCFEFYICFSVLTKLQCCLYNPGFCVFIFHSNTDVLVCLNQTAVCRLTLTSMFAGKQVGSWQYWWKGQISKFDLLKWCTFLVFFICTLFSQIYVGAILARLKMHGMPVFLLFSVI